ncbi:MAG: acetyl-CoA carboxylase biotin carboxyl carrier protein [Gammaproteobacteria bacterium]|nr:acetyl-CoA carboxylase biotin carboxyl carrier protein [Gammaproteobacteria bacterium]MCH9712786.1 acetyl-CoA carboxylase biotin carboxyl carrier protein [Pseudomonadota bacterium]MCH9763299.1 acetyl-CoA carboxylase biotin carboxyl carrier protein [Gammaproteobacteria bacterium]
MDIRKIKKLIELLTETGISEIEIKEGEESLRLTRHTSPAHAQTITEHVVSAPATQHLSTAAPTEPKAPSMPSGHKVNSPMVGTYYSASSPETPPFVSVGQTVAAGDTLCIIEAMKMFNEIEADKAGVVKAILVSNGEPVEYDELLFIIE